MLTLTRALALYLCLSSPALAECVTPESLVKGVTFKREDGSAGLIRAKADMFEINYITNPKGSLSDQRQSIFGLYDTYRDVFPTEEPVMDAPTPGSGIYRYKFRNNPPLPNPGTTWTTKVYERHNYPYWPGVHRTSYSVTYSYQDVTKAKLSGCNYRILPVEATFTNKDTDLTRRFIYFPDLGFSLETRVIDRKGEDSRELGLTSLTPKG